jgi:hypothetical protein
MTWRTGKLSCLPKAASRFCAERDDGSGHSCWRVLTDGETIWRWLSCINDTPLPKSSTKDRTPCSMPHAIALLVEERGKKSGVVREGDTIGVEGRDFALSRRWMLFVSMIVSVTARLSIDFGDASKSEKGFEKQTRKFLDSFQLLRRKEFVRRMK